MANPFDQFDEPATAANPFDQFDAPAKPSGALRKAVGDKVVGFASGAVGATKAIADAAGAGNEVSNTLEDVNKGINDYLSPEAKADQQEQSAIMAGASGKGVWEGVKAGARAFAVAPVQTAVQGFGSIVPVLAGGLAGLPGAAATGIAIGAGTAKGAIYDRIKKEGGTEEAATQAQAYDGANTDQIALGGALGAADALTGVSRVAGGMVRNAIGKPVVQAATQTAERGVMARMGMGVLGEMPLEAAQGGQEQVAANLAAQRAGYQSGTWDNVASNATLEALASAGPGAVFGALDRRTPATPPTQPPVAPTGSTPPGAPPVAPPGAPLQLGNTPDPYLSFADGTVARKSEFDNYINSLPPEQQNAERAKVMGLAPQPSVAETLPPAATTPPAIEPSITPQQISEATDIGLRQVVENLSFDTNKAGDRLNTPQDKLAAQLAQEEIDRRQSGVAPAAPTPDAPIAPTQTPAEQAGINASAGPLSAAAATAVNAGITPITQAPPTVEAVTPTQGPLASAVAVDAKQANLARIRAANNPQPTTLGTQTNAVAGPGFNANAAMGMSNVQNTAQGTNTPAVEATGEAPQAVAGNAAAPGELSAARNGALEGVGLNQPVAPVQQAQASTENVAISTETQPGPGGVREPVSATLRDKSGSPIDVVRAFRGRYDFSIEGKPAGSVLYTDMPTGGHKVTGINVNPEFQRRGVATSVYDFLEQHVVNGTLQTAGAQSKAGAAFREARARRGQVVAENVENEQPISDPFPEPKWWFDKSEDERLLLKKMHGFNNEDASWSAMTDDQQKQVADNYAEFESGNAKFDPAGIPALFGIKGQPKKRGEQAANTVVRQERIDSTLKNGGHVVGNKLRMSNGMTQMILTDDELSVIPESSKRAAPNPDDARLKPNSTPAASTQSAPIGVTPQAPAIAPPANLQEGIARVRAKKAQDSQPQGNTNVDQAPQAIQTTEEGQKAPAAAVADQGDGINDSIRALRAKSFKTVKQNGPRGDVRLSTGGEYVSFDDAVAEARKAVASGVRPVPFQIHNALDVNIGETDRIIAALGEPVAKPVTPQVAPAAAPKKPAGGRNLRADAYSKNPLLTFLATHGLFHDKTKPGSQKSEYSPDKAITVSGYGPVFKRTGKQPSDLVVNAIQDGYLPINGTVDHLDSLIRRAINGEKISPLYAEGVAEQIAEQSYEEHLAQQQEAAQDDDFDPFESVAELGFTLDDAEASGYDAALDPIKLEVNALLAKAEELGIDAETIKEDAHYATAEQSEQAYYEAARDTLQAAIAASSGNRSTNAGSESNAGSQEGLTATTPEQLRDDEARATQIAKDKAKADQDAEAKAKDARIAKEIAARQEASADNFQLGQSAVDSLAGQGSIFDAPAPVGNTAPQSTSPAVQDFIDGNRNDAPTIEEVAAERPAKPDTLSEKEKAAKAKMFSALGKLAALAGKNTRMNWTPEEEQQLLPIVIELFDGAMELGSVTFKKAVRYVREFIGSNLDQETADAIPFETLQGAYIHTARKFKDKGATTGKEVMNFESMEELEKDTEKSTGAKPAATTKRTLSESLLQAIRQGNMPKDNPALKKLVEAFDGAAPDQTRMKEAQEQLEVAIVMAAREVAGKSEGDKSTFDALLRLYESQPNLNIRTSTSIANQAYSTPAPLAYLASRLAGITNKTVALEPTGGTGMLLIGANPEITVVNELNDLRVSLLKEQGFKPTQKDAATENLTDSEVDVVITNPPFGSVKGEDGRPVKVKVDNYDIGQIDHLIAARALSKMKEDGKAVLIIGANKVPGGLNTDDRIFFNWLYAHYNVTGHFEVNGDLYSRQGAGWPVRVITIDGRQKSNKFSPVAGTIQRADNWSQVYEQYKQILDTSGKPLTGAGGSVGGSGNSKTGLGGSQKPSGAKVPAADRRPSPTGGAGRAGNVAGASAGTASDGKKPDTKPVGSSADEQRLNGQSSQPSGLEPSGSIPKPIGAGFGKLAGADALATAGNEFQSPYTPRSARKDEGVLIPANMAQPTQDALSQLEDEVGDIDEFARKELGYKAVSDLHNALMGLQVDSVAMAIHQIQKGKAVVIADQTGIGKGRQAAAIIRWAAKKGMTPVFVSVKPSLFTDMYGDLSDIGTSDINPFIMNSDAWVAGEDGVKLFANKAVGHRSTLESIASTGALPEGSNALFMTYSQINVNNIQRQALMALAPNAVFILDESHNAAGASATGQFMIDTLGLAKGVTYLSATYAKRPDNMPLYFKTDIGDAAADATGLAEAMASGGLPLQTVVSNNLVKAGQMFRRERSYDGVSISSTFDTANRALHERMSNEATSALRAIVSADKMFHEVYVKQLADELASQGATVIDNAGNQMSAGVQHTEFSSVVHNFVKQMLLGLKAQTAANEAIASLKRGEKPIIAVENTMGSFLNEYAASNNISQGDTLGAFDYRTVLSRALARSRVITEKAPNGTETKRPVPLSELGAETRAAYEKAQKVIDGLVLDIPVSPIDWMRAEIIRAGFSVAEITGRNLSVDYSNPKKPTLTAIDLSEQKDKVNTTRQFNSGKLDALILNVAGSTGISLHASEKFEDQRQRHMIVAQAAGDINIFMQMLGRVHRTGQVRLPKYTILSVDLPTEKRPTAVLSVKMKSLNANTSSNTESATSVKSSDILNKYGDQIVAQYLSDNFRLMLDLDLTGAQLEEDDIARKATGRLALQSIEVQHAFYDDVEAQYNALIDYLNKTNQNDLEPRTFDFDAKETRTEVLFDGPNKGTPFGEDAIYGEYSIKAQGTPMKPEEIKALMASNLGGQTGTNHASALIESMLQTFTDQMNASREKHGLVPGKFDEDKYRSFMTSVYGEDAAEQWVAKAKAKIAAGGQVESISKEAMRNVAGNAAGMAFIRSHPIGATFRVDINSEPYNAVVTNIHSTHKSTGNPFSLSKIQLTVAVNGSLRSINVPSTQFRKIEVSDIAPYFRIEQLFKEQPPNQRETAKIVTGNLLAAYGEIKGTRGTIITFTKQDGTSEQGILLPKLFDFTKNTQGDYRLQSGVDALTFLQTSENKDIGRFGIMSRDGIVRVLPAGRGVRVQVPKTKLKGGKFFLDKGLIAAGGDFVSSGNFMASTVYEPGSAVKMLDLLMKKQALYALPSMAPEAKEMLDAKDASKPNDGAKFFTRVSPPEKQLPLYQIKRLVESALSGMKNAPTVRVVANPEAIGLTPPVDTVPSGVTMTNGDIYVFQSGIGSVLDVDMVVFHELFHKGLQNVMPKADYVAAMQEISKADAKVRQYASEWSAKKAGKAALAELAEKYSGKELADQYEALATEEALARIAEDLKAKREMGNKPLMVRRLVAWLAKLADKVGMTRLADKIRALSYNAAEKFVVDTIGKAGGRGPGGWVKFSAGDAAQTDTAAFRKWFGGSKVVDAAGKPLVVYHGTQGDITEFDEAKIGERFPMSHGFYATTSKERASIYADSIQNAAEGWRAESRFVKPVKTGANVMPVYVSIKNPKIITGKFVASEDVLDANMGKIVRDAKAEGYDGVIVRNERGDEYSEMTVVAFNPTQIKSATGNNGDFDATNPDIRFRAADKPAAATNPNSWDAPEASKFDDLVYKLQDKQIDTKRVIESIKLNGALSDEKNVYLQEELFHGRAAARTEDFVNKELSPLVNMMKLSGIDIAALDEYLHARHAEEANKLIADRNPDILDGGSGMTTQDAKDYLAKLPQDEKAKLEAVAAKVDAILGATRQLYSDYDLESQKTVDGWGAMFKHYVPLMREDKDGGMGIGQGISIKGREVKSRTGSTRKVVDILANIALQRERAIVRGEKNRVATALVGLVKANPNKDFWHTGYPPSEKVYDAKTNKVITRADPLYKSRENVVVAKIRKADGTVVEQAVIFNEDDARAVRMAAALKNLDAAQLEGLLGVSAKITRYFAAINTQYNPIFGTVNLVRDVQGALFNLTTTPLKGQTKAIAGDTLSALKGIYIDARAARDGKTPTSKWAALWEEFQNEGGQTGFRDLFANSADRAKAIERELNPNAWMDSPLGKVFTADGTLKVPLSVAQKKATGVFDWLSDYNLAMENAVRLASYKAGIDQGMSKPQAASLAKNLTVNFNRKGQVGQQAGALYAFFNASMQGTARLGQTLFTMEPGKPKTIRLSTTGKKIVYGGVLLGVAQAVLLSAAGFDDEEPPDFVRERSMIIPTGGKTYITIPMPLGLHVLPNMGRIPTEFVMGGLKDPAKHIAKMLGLFAGTFNPIGGGASLVQMLSPTAIDPLVALAENKDWTGKPIAKVSFDKAIPGHQLAKDTASTPAKFLSEAINLMTGGTEYAAGVLSPTPDQIDYLWGQATGGVGREVNKANQTVSSVISGEELPPHKMPLVGRFYGNADAQSSQSNQFYANINRLNKHEAEIKGRRKDGDAAGAAQYLSENPDARLFMAGNKAERDVQKLRSLKRDLIDRDADKAQVTAIEDRIKARVAQFNELVKAYAEKEAA